MECWMITLLEFVCVQGESGATSEEEMWNGLFKGHAYSVTGLLEVGVTLYHKTDLLVKYQSLYRAYTNSTFYLLWSYLMGVEWCS